MREERCLGERRLWVLCGVRAWRDDTSCGYCCGISMSGERWSGSQVGEGWESVLEEADVLCGVGWVREVCVCMRGVSGGC